MSALTAENALEGILEASAKVWGAASGNRGRRAVNNERDSVASVKKGYRGGVVWCGSRKVIKNIPREFKKQFGPNFEKGPFRRGTGKMLFLEEIKNKVFVCLLTPFVQVLLGSHK